MKGMSPISFFQIKMEPEQSPPPSFTAIDALDEEKSPDSLLNSTMATTKQQQQQQQNNINLLNDSPETRAMKRERNRLAARRCRQKQKDRIDYLEKVSVWPLFFCKWFYFQNIWKNICPVPSPKAINGSKSFQYWFLGRQGRGFWLEIGKMKHWMEYCLVFNVYITFQNKSIASFI